jgi:tetratricopeptide (TPR) repeat protein
MRNQEMSNTTSDTDQLKRKLKKSRGLGHIKILNELSEILLESDSAAALKHAQAAVKAMGLKDYPKENITALLNSGQANLNLRKYDQAFAYFTKALELIEDVENQTQAALVRYFMGETRYRAGRYLEAIEYYKKALEHFESIPDMGKISQIGYHLGTAYGKINEYDRALPVFEKAAEAFGALGDNAGVGVIEGCIGLIFHGTGNYKTALKYHLRALKIAEEQNDPIQIAKNYVNTGNDYQSLGQADNALKYINRAKHIREKSGDIEGLISVHINLGVLYCSLKDYKSAIQNYQDALILNHKLSNTEIESFVLNNIGHAYTQMGEYKKATGYLNKAFSMVKNADLPINEGLITDSIRELAETTGDYKKALKFYKRHQELNNKIFNEQVSKKIAEIEAAHEMKKREQDIILLKEKLRLQNRKLALLIGHSAEKRELLHRFQQEIARINEKGSGRDEIFLDKRSLQKMLNTEKDMKKFREAFDQVYPGFYERLSNMGINLTRQEKNICLLIKIGLQSPMISNVLCVSPRTVENHRFKIRQKIRLPQGQNLKAFLESYSAVE